MCPVTFLREYEARSASVRSKTLNKNPLLISFCKPHKPVSSPTVARWIKSVLKEAGIDTEHLLSFSRNLWIIVFLLLCYTGQNDYDIFFISVIFDIMVHDQSSCIKYMHLYQMDKYDLCLSKNEAAFPGHVRIITHAQCFKVLY